MKCNVCSKVFKNQGKWNCCKKLDNICLTCSYKKCPDCKKLHAQDPKPALKKPNAKSRQNLMRPIQKTSKCSFCRQFVPSTSIMFMDKKCKCQFCYDCIRNYYVTYLKLIKNFKGEGDQQPEIPVQVPCHCDYPQKQIIDYLQQSCYSCCRKIQGQSYELTNNTRVMKQCYLALEERVNRISATAADKKQYKDISELIAKCSSCSQFITSSNRKINNIYICESCQYQMTLTEQAYKKKKQEEQIRTTMNYKKYCTICSALFVTKRKQNDPPLLCKKCQLDEGVKARQIDRNVKEKKEQKGILKVEEPKKQLKLEQIKQSKQHQDQQLPSYSIKQLNQRIRKEYFDKDGKNNKQAESIRIKSEPIQEEQEIRSPPQKHSQHNIGFKQESIDRDPLGFFKVQQYQLSIKYEQPQHLIQCDRCWTIYPVNYMFKVFEKTENGKAKLRILEGQQIKIPENQMHFCQQCYLDVKIQDLVKKNNERKKKIEAEIYGRYMRSVPKKEKERLQPNVLKTNMFKEKDNYDYKFTYQNTSKMAALLDRDSPKKTALSGSVGSKFSMQKRCRYCTNLMNVSLYRTQILCEDCQLRKKELDINSRDITIKR